MNDSGGKNREEGWKNGMRLQVSRSLPGQEEWKTSKTVGGGKLEIRTCRYHLDTCRKTGIKAESTASPYCQG